VGRLYVNKANLVAMNAQLTEQLGMVKVAGTLQQSTQVTTLVNNLMRAPELQQTVVQMQKEMMKVVLMPLPFFNAPVLVSGLYLACVPGYRVSAGIRMTGITAVLALQ